MKVLISLVGAVAVVMSAGAVSVHAQAQDPASVVAAAQAQVRAGNLDALMAYFSDDAQVTYNGTLYSGKVGVRQFMQWSLSEHLQATTAGEYQVSGSKVSWREIDSTDSLRKIGVASVYTTCEAVVENGLIKSQVFTTEPASVAEIQRAQAAATSAGMPATGDGNGPLDLMAIAALGAAVVMVGITLRLFKGTGRASN